MKLLLIGSNGQLGFELKSALAPLGELVCLERHHCELSDVFAIRQILEDVAPDVIVNAAAYTAVDRAESERELAFAVNTSAPAAFAEFAARKNALLVHYSTDYVFDGQKKAPYDECDVCQPLNVYGESKLAGELAIANSGCRHLIFRTSWVLGGHGGNFAKTMLRLAAQKTSLSVVNDQTGSPTSARLLADISAFLVRESQVGRGNFPYGLYHLTNSGQTTWFEYAQYVIEYARRAGYRLSLPADGLLPIPSASYATAAKRPMNSLLSCDRLRQTFSLTLPDWRVSLEPILQQFFEKV